MFNQHRVAGLMKYVGLAAMFSIVAACGGSSGDGGSGDGHVTLTFLGSDPPATVQPVISAFEKTHRNTTVKYENVPFADINTTLSARVGKGSTDPDVFMADYPTIPALAQRHILMPLDDLLPAARSVLLPDGIDASTYKGHLYALPGRASTNVLFYNKKLLAAAKIKAPSIDPEQRLTWETVLQEARQAQSAGAQWGLFFDQVSRYYQLQPLAESAGGGPGLTGGGQTPALRNPGWQKAMSFYHDLFSTGVSPRGIPVTQSPDLFTGAKVAFWVGGPWWLPQFSKTAGLDFGVAPFPYFQGGKPVTPTGSWSYGVNPHTKHKAAAVEFVRWLTMDPTGNEALFQGRFLPPANLKALDAYYAEVAKVAPSGTGDLIKYEIGHTGVPRPRIVGWLQFDEATTNMFEDIRNGQSADAAITAADGRLKEMLARVPS